MYCTLSICEHLKKKRTLTHTCQFHPPKLGIGAKCILEDLETSNFQAFPSGDHNIVFVEISCFSGNPPRSL